MVVFGFLAMLLTQKKKILTNLLLEEVDEKEMIINKSNKTKKVYGMFRVREVEGFFSI